MVLGAILLAAILACPAHAAARAGRVQMSGFDVWLRAQFVSRLHEDPNNFIAAETAQFLDGDPAFPVVAIHRGQKADFPDGALAFYSSGDDAIYVDRGLLEAGSDEDFMRDPDLVRRKIGFALPTLVHEITHALDYRATRLPAWSLDTEVLAFAREIHYMFLARRDRGRALPRSEDDFEREKAAWFKKLLAWKREHPDGDAPAPCNYGDEACAIQRERQLADSAPPELRSSYPRHPDQLEQNAAANVAAFRGGYERFAADLQGHYPGKKLVVAQPEEDLAAAGLLETRDYFRRKLEGPRSWIVEDSAAR